MLMPTDEIRNVLIHIMDTQGIQKAHEWVEIYAPVRTGNYRLELHEWINNTLPNSMKKKLQDKEMFKMKDLEQSDFYRVKTSLCTYLQRFLWKNDLLPENKFTESWNIIREIFDDLITRIQFSARSAVIYYFYNGETLIFQRNDVTNIYEEGKIESCRVLWINVLLPRLAQLYPEDFPAENRAIRNEKTEYTVML